MKRKTINQRRERRKAKDSGYARKLALQKKGIYSINSPFKPSDTGVNRFVVLETHSK